MEMPCGVIYKINGFVLKTENIELLFLLYFYIKDVSKIHASSNFDRNTGL